MTLLGADATGARIAAIIVTYNSARTLPRLLESLRRSTAGVRAIVVDNGSTDASVAVARGYREATVIATGRNAGYSAGINVGRAAVRPGEAVAILNPDVELAPDALERLLVVLDDPSVGIVAPQLRTLDGRTRFDSLRREPSVLGALGDSVFGSRWRTRPAVLAETLRREPDYAAARDVAWAGGAALLISAECDLAVGEWDAATYFLYSEETDYARRARELGYRVRYEPSAIAWHLGSGSGQPAALVALVSVNRIRYYERVHGPAATALFHGAVVVQHALRPFDARHRFALGVVPRRSRWTALPAGEGRP